MAMFKTGLTAIRSNEHLILNKEKHVYVNGAIAQYLLNHQIIGVRFLYRNYEKVRQIEYTFIHVVCQHKHENPIEIDFVFFFSFFVFDGSANCMHIE